jgi:eukaryotic-like serine/threonine-protein kinase
MARRPVRANISAPMDFLLPTCAACRREFRIDRKHAGRTVACPHCGKAVSVAAAAAPVDRLVGKEIGGCRLVRRLGAGALGVVYEGADPELGPVAVKLLSSKAAEVPEVVARFEREAALSAGIRDPHVVAVYRHGFDRGVHWLVMEFVSGGTLASLAEDGRQDWRDALALVRQAAEGVACLHRAGILHRDIKPANILWTDGPDGRTAKLADLGLAKEQAGADAESLTMQGVALGSPAYMPPEQIRDARSVTAAADVYALGVTLFQLIAGRLPFEGKGGAAVMGKVLQEPAPAIAGLVPLPAGVAALIMRCLAKDPADRPADAGALVTAFDNVLRDPEHVDAPPRAARSQPLRALIAVFAAICALAGLAWYLAG